VDLALDRAAKQPVPRRVELDLVDPVAVAVVGAEDRKVALRAVRVLPGLNAAANSTGLTHALRPPGPTFAPERLLQREVDIEQVDRLERWRLVEDGPRGVALSGSRGVGDRRRVARFDGVDLELPSVGGRESGFTS
jgi:hypothetical protein